MVIDNVFCPDREFEDFAQSIVDNFNELELGTYCSENKNYKIELVDSFSEEEGGNANVAIVDLTDKRFQLNKLSITDPKNGYVNNKDILLFWIAWMYIGYENQDWITNDTIAIKYCLKKGLLKNNLMEGYLQALKHNPIDLNLERYENIINLCK